MVEMMLQIILGLPYVLTQSWNTGQRINNQTLSNLHGIQ
jgi:hypothetical protein